MVAGGRRGRCRKVLGPDVETAKVRGMQLPLDDDGRLGAAGELDDMIRAIGLGGGKRQGLSETDEIVCVLDDVMAKPLDREPAVAKLAVERHVADRLVERQVSCPGTL